MSKLNLTWHTSQAKKTVEEPLQAGAVLSHASINLNNAALSLLSTPEKIVMAYDADAKVIAIKASTGDKGEEPLVVYEINKTLKNGSVTIRAKDFMSKVREQMGLELEGKDKIACPASFNSRRKLLIIQVLPVEEIDEV